MTKGDRRRVGSPGSHLALLAAVASLAAAPPLRAGPAARKLTWDLARGALQPSLAAGGFLLATDASPSRFSDGELVASEPVALPYRLDVTWRRLGPEAGRSLHVAVIGGVVLIKTGAVAFYAFDEARFAADGWTPVPGLRTHDEHRVSVVQDVRTVALTVDGAEVKRFAFAAARGQGRVGVGFKGASGNRSRLFVRALAVSELGPQGTASQ